MHTTRHTHFQNSINHRASVRLLIIYLEFVTIWAEIQWSFSRGLSCPWKSPVSLFIQTELLTLYFFSCFIFQIIFFCLFIYLWIIMLSLIFLCIFSILYEDCVLYLKGHSRFSPCFWITLISQHFIYLSDSCFVPTNIIFL